MIAEGHQPYVDIRYFYGPLGVYALGGTFAVFGASFTTAFAFGLVQAAAICAVFYLLSRRLLDVVPPPASRSLIVRRDRLLRDRLQLRPPPHQLRHLRAADDWLLMLLALSHKRLLLASLAAGLVCLTRPEFAAIAVLTLGAYLLGTWSPGGGWRPTLRALPRSRGPRAGSSPGSSYAVLAAEAGASQLFTENLWPVDFLSTAGFTSQKSVGAENDLESSWHLCPGGHLLTLFAAVVDRRVAGPAQERHTAGERALLPTRRRSAGLGLVDLVWRVLGIWEAGPQAVQGELNPPDHRDELAAGARLRRLRPARRAFPQRERARSPATGPSTWRWSPAAAALGARAYDAFTAEGSYAPYYAPPLVLLLAALHDRVAKRWPQARWAAAAVAVPAVAVGGAPTGRCARPAQKRVVHTERGSFKTTAASAPACRAR